MSSTAPPATKQPLQPYTKYFVLYLLLTIGSVWALTMFYLVAQDFAVQTLGELHLRNPIVIIILHSPAIAAFLIFFLHDGIRGIGNFFLSLIPRKKDLLWLPVLILIMAVYIFAIRYLCILFGIEVPPEPLAPLDMVLTFLELFYMEIGMVAIAIGWFGFFLPLMHRVTRSHITAGFATGMGIAVFVAPGNVFASFELAIAWPLYAAQLCVLCTAMSFLLSRMKGNVVFFLVPFWVSASGSALQLYIFQTTTQFIQLGVFAALAVVLYFVLKQQAPGGQLDERFTFPEYLENEYTVRQGSPVPGVGDRSKENAAGAPAMAGAGEGASG